ncbi:MAG: Ig-like domain-containing protein [Isosphaeraceae bacterium]
MFIAQLNAGTVALPPSAPSSPTLQAASDTGLSNSDRITNATALTFNVDQAVAGNLVELLRNGVVVASRTGPAR